MIPYGVLKRRCDLFFFFFFFFFLLFTFLEKSLCPPPLFGAELRHCICKFGELNILILN